MDKQLNLVRACLTPAAEAGIRRNPIGAVFFAAEVIRGNNQSVIDYINNLPVDNGIKCQLRLILQLAFLAETHKG